MYLSSGNTQVYSPFGSYVVEQHDSGIDRHSQCETVHEQANAALRVQQYCQMHGVGPTPTRLQILWNILLHKHSAKQN
jgi:hypothetical protein